MPERKKIVVPRLRFPEFRNAGEWKVAPLKTLAVKRTQRNRDGKLILILTNSAEMGVVNQRDYFDKDIAVQGNLNNYLIVGKGDFVYNPRISASAPVGPISRNNIEKGVMSPLYTVFRFNNRNSDFYAHYFKSSAWHSYLRRVGNIGARHDRMAISNDDFMAMPIPDPLPDEQRKIADCLSSVDEVIELETQKLEVLKTHKKGLMQQLFPREGEAIPRLRFPEFRNAGKWEVKRLSNTLHRISNGLTIAQVSGSCGVKVTRIETISTGRIDPNKVGYVNTDQDITQYKLRIGDILFSHINSLTHIGKSAYVDKDYNLYHGMNLLRLSVDAESNDSKFVFYLINTSIFQSSVRARANQAINQASINQTELGQSCVLIPTKKEQQKIADCLSSLDEVIELEAQKLDVLKTHKKGLMQQLFPQEVD